jgi:hypothetical protein
MRTAITQTLREDCAWKTQNTISNVTTYVVGAERDMGTPEGMPLQAVMYGSHGYMCPTPCHDPVY